jgi:acyl carrier protein
MADLARNLVIITKTMSNPGFSFAANLPAGIEREPATVADAQLRDLLKRCPPETLTTVRRFRRTREAALVGPIVLGVMARYVDHENRDRLHEAAPEMRLSEDLGLDSLTMIELAMTLEDVLQIPLNDERLRSLQTLGDINRFVAESLKA